MKLNFLLLDVDTALYDFGLPILKIQNLSTATRRDAWVAGENYSRSEVAGGAAQPWQ